VIIIIITEIGVIYLSTFVFFVQHNQHNDHHHHDNHCIYYVGPIPPWFKRYGHSLDAVDINGDGVSDVMILMGGYSPSPSNDVWVTEDGVNWG